MTLIFSASSDQASWQHSSRLIEPILRWLFPHLPNPQVEAWVFFFRKCAHFTEYAILAVLVWRALSAAEGQLQNATEAPAPAWRWRPALLALALVVAYAISDEVHQKFVPTREASALDVLIDSTGAAVGLALVRAFKLWKRGTRLPNSAADKPHF